PDAFHLRLHLAMAVGAHAAAGSVAQVLRAVHRAGHAGRGQRALPAHLAVEQQALEVALGPGERLLQARMADAIQQWCEGDERRFQRLIGALHEARMTDGPETDGVHSTLTCVALYGRPHVVAPARAATWGRPYGPRLHAALRRPSKPDSAIAS